MQCFNVSTIDFVKEIATKCGWKGEKSPKNRAFLSDLKELLTRWDDVPFKATENTIKRIVGRAMGCGYQSDEILVFIHCREPEEIKKFVERLGAKTLLIRRPEVEYSDQSNCSDAEVLNYDYDYCITNNGTVDELKDKAINFLKQLGFENKLK